MTLLIATTPSVSVPVRHVAETAIIIGTLTKMLSQMFIIQLLTSLSFSIPILLQSLAISTT